ncbi:MAG TPA: hypothetical protein VNP73_04700, partial [Actinomycetota bacterium]|nr:hypothetical protein [Actinomycetota bacterium]
MAEASARPSRTRLQRIVAGAILLVTCLSFPSPATGDETSIQDPSDSPGRLDIITAGAGHDSSAEVLHTITFEDEDPPVEPEQIGLGLKYRGKRRVRLAHISIKENPDGS